MPYLIKELWILKIVPFKTKQDVQKLTAYEKRGYSKYVELSLPDIFLFVTLDEADFSNIHCLSS